MKRNVIDELIAWKEPNHSSPILLTGAKGVGKTHLAYDFARSFFEHIYYINFEYEPRALHLFDAVHPEMISEHISEYLHLKPEEPTESRILILDEISFCRNKKLFHLTLSDKFHSIIYISSVPIKDQINPNIKIIPIYPLEFDEFLRATGNDWYIEAIVTHFNQNRKIPDIVHRELLILHELYLKIGGMPGVINEYLNMASTVNVAEQHRLLLGSYRDYMIRVHSETDALKMIQVFDSLVQQLIKENRKFQYKLIRKGTTHTMYKDAIQSLTDYHYVIRCNRIRNEQFYQNDNLLSFQLPQEETNFKLYYPDPGLLSTMLLAEQGGSIQKHRKALLENYIACSLMTKNYLFAFWESESMAKIDFIYQNHKAIIPVELFVDHNTRSKSISILKKNYEIPYSVKISAGNFDYRNRTKYIPYYAAFCL